MTNDDEMTRRRINPCSPMKREELCRDMGNQMEEMEKKRKSDNFPFTFTFHCSPWNLERT